MRRKALLTITGCSAKRFEIYSARGLLPFPIPKRAWSDYSLEDAFRLRLLILAAEVTDLSSASFLAGRALDALKPLNPFAASGCAGLWVALVRFDCLAAPDNRDRRHVVAGRWEDFQSRVASYIAAQGWDADLKSIQLHSASAIAFHLRGAVAAIQPTNSEGENR